MSYEPFPEIDLEALARENDKSAAKFEAMPRWHDRYTRTAAMLRNAVACHAAVRERMLIAEMELTQLRRKVS